MTSVQVVRKPEQDLKAQIKEMLNARGVYCLPTKGTAHTRGGDPDLIACYRGAFVGIEAKAGTGQHGQQKHRQECIIANGGLYILAKSVDDVKDALDAIDLCEEC